MVDTFGKLVTPGINPAALTETEWFSVPAGHEYQGYVRVGYLGTTSATFKIAGVSGTGVSPIAADWETGILDLDVGTSHDISFDMGELETLIVYASSADVVFNYRGLDIDNA